MGDGGASLRALGGDRAGQVRFARWLNNPHVTPAEMVATARRALLDRVRGRQVLAIQDTTSLRDDGAQCGLSLHPTLVLDAAEGALLGLLAAEFLVRDGRVPTHCNKRRLGEKESRRWIASLQQAADLLAAGAAGVIAIADREADLYETFACRPAAVEVLVRVHHNRCLTQGRLYECHERLSAWGCGRVAVPARPGRQARQAQVAVRAGTVCIKRPKRNRARWAAELEPSVTLTLLEAREIDAPAGETPLHWRLLSTLPVNSRAEAWHIIDLYRQRWVIEQVFRTMKTQGFAIEAVRVRETQPLKNLACATLIAAIEIQQMLHDRDGRAERPMSDVADPADQPAIEAIGRSLEGRTQRQKNPHPPGSLARLAWICARLGGWTGYYGKPGPIVLLRGHTRLKFMLEGISRSGLV